MCQSLGPSFSRRHETRVFFMSGTNQELNVGSNARAFGPGSGRLEVALRRRGEVSRQSASQAGCRAVRRSVKAVCQSNEFGHD